ncbi:MAG: hypothetical protein Tsb0015_15890 [Simkaniaceae bacterium]
MSVNLEQNPASFFERYHIMPQKDFAVRKNFFDAVLLSEEEDFLSSHLLSTCQMLQSSAIAFFQIPMHLTKGCTDFTACILKLNWQEAFDAVRENSMDAAQCLILSCASLACLAAGILFPKQVYPLFRPAYFESMESLQLKRHINEQESQIRVSSENLASSTSAEYVARLEEEKRSLEETVRYMENKIESLQIEAPYNEERAIFMQQLQSLQGTIRGLKKQISNLPSLEECLKLKEAVAEKDNEILRLTQIENKALQESLAKVQYEAARLRDSLIFERKLNDLNVEVINNFSQTDKNFEQENQLRMKFMKALRELKDKMEEKNSQQEPELQNSTRDFLYQSIPLQVKPFGFNQLGINFAGEGECFEIFNLELPEHRDRLYHFLEGKTNLGNYHLRREEFKLKIQEALAGNNDAASLEHLPGIYSSLFNNT